MSKIKYIILAFCAAVLLTACQDQVQSISGSYAYKISGNAVIKGDEQKLPAEQGTMEIIRVKADTVLVTFNALAGNLITGLNGDVYATEAVISGDTITLEPYDRTIVVNSKEYAITASGEGKIYEKTILFTLDYESTDLEAQLTMLCKKN